MDATRRFDTLDGSGGVRQVLAEVVQALEEKGYDPVSQLVGYLLTGDPAYITGHQRARHLIQELDRDAILEELVHSYLFG